MIDVVRPIDYEQLYAQAMAALRSNERYWFDEKEEAIMTEANREFEQSPAIEQIVSGILPGSGRGRRGRMVACCGYIAADTKGK